MGSSRSEKGELVGWIAGWLENGLGKLLLPEAVSHQLPIQPTNSLISSRHLPFRHPHWRGTLRCADAEEAGWGKAAHADLERVTGPHRDLLTEEHDGFAERIRLHDSCLPNRLRPGADRELISGQ